MTIPLQPQKPLDDHLDSPPTTPSKYPEISPISKGGNPAQILTFNPAPPRQNTHFYVQSLADSEPSLTATFRGDPLLG